VSDKTQVLELEAALDALAQSVVSRLGCQVSLISVRHNDKLVSIGHSQAPERFEERMYPANETICSQTVELSQPLKINTVRSVPWIANLPLVRKANIQSYLGAPVVLADGRCIGAICCLSPHPRIWTDDELNFLILTGKIAASQIDNALLREENRRLSSTLDGFDQILATLSQDRNRARSVHNPQGDIVFASDAMKTELGVQDAELGVLQAAMVQARTTDPDGTGAMVRLNRDDGLPVWFSVQWSESHSGLILCDWAEAQADTELAEN